MRLYEIIKSARKKSGLTQTQLAHLTGSKKPEKIMDVETGKRIPRDDTVWEIGSILSFPKHKVERCLKLADYHRKHRDELKSDYVIRSVKKRLR